MFQKKVDRAFAWLKEKNNIEEDEQEYTSHEEWKEKNEIYYERGDYFALILSAILVFSPIFIVLIGITVLIARSF